jgi:arginine exporter protein ArgO
VGAAAGRPPTPPTPVTGALVAGLVAGYGVAIPLGAIAPLLISLTARAGLRVGAAAALGVASADGLYAAAAVVGGAALAEAIAPAADTMRWVAAGALAALALRLTIVACRDHRRPVEAAPTPGMSVLATPARAYGGLLGLTLLNPATIVYFVALVLGDRAGGGRSPTGSAVFVAAVVAASASWQLLLAGGGAVVGRHLVTARGRLATALVSSAVVAALAGNLALG